MEQAKGIKAAIVAFCAALTALWGWFGWLILVLLFALVIDYVTGSAAAARRGDWSSKVAREGRWHKVGTLLAVAAACLMDVLVGLALANVPVALPWDYTVLFGPVVVVWYTITEIGSIIENAGALGAPIPAFLRKAIKLLKTSADAAGDRILPGGKEPPDAQ